MIERRKRTGLAGALITIAALATAPAAMANITPSTNWAGYAIHRAGVSFHQVSATWTQPEATCAPGQPSYSADWVGLGGYKPTSDALEQTGTEVDCTAAGKVVSSAWYELVPAPSKTISLTVNPGDVVRATVTVAGHQVAIRLADLTSGRSFDKTFRSASIDVSSAEWIVEAPSECLSQFTCQALPLADFGSVPFSGVTATSSTGATASIKSRLWGRTRIDLVSGPAGMIVARNATAHIGNAAPSPLSGGGGSFDVTYTPASSGDAGSFARIARVSAGYIRH